MKTIINKRELRIIAFTLVAGLILGWLFFHKPGNTNRDKHEYTEDQEQATIWTCSMHPQIKQDRPGLCPICAMELVPLNSLESGDENVTPDEIQMGESAVKLADIQTAVVTKGTPEKSLSLSGKVKPDERNISELTARFGGRIEKLHVNYTGQNVVKGQKLATIYSPELVTAQKELLEAVKLKETSPSYYKAAKSKLELWDLTDSQINSIEEKSEPTLHFEILSPVTGIVTQKHVSPGDYLKEGSTLFEIIDLTKIWIMFDAYESDLPWIKNGDQVEFTVKSLPGRTFEGKVTQIDPFIDASTRVAGVRVELPNPGLTLKPEMFVTGVLHSQIAEKSSELLIPKSSVLWTGKRAVVYVKVPDRKTSSFLYREITLGPDAGNFYIVARGLTEGEEIAINGVFKIDAAAQLAGKPSMMNPKGGKVSTGHNHGNMNMTPETTDEKEIKHSTTLSAHKQKSNIQHETFRVEGNCSMCKARIEEAALSLNGVNSAEWGEETKMIHLSFNADKVKLENIHKAIARAGHDTEKETAPGEVYDNLPECCKYRRIK